MMKKIIIVLLICAVMALGYFVSNYDIIKIKCGGEYRYNYETYVITKDLEKTLKNQKQICLRVLNS